MPVCLPWPCLSTWFKILYSTIGSASEFLDNDSPPSLSRSSRSHLISLSLSPGVCVLPVDLTCDRRSRERDERRESFRGFFYIIICIKQQFLGRSLLAAAPSNSLTSLIILLIWWLVLSNSFSCRCRFSRNSGLSSRQSVNSSGGRVTWITISISDWSPMHFQGWDNRVVTPALGETISTFGITK